MILIAYLVAKFIEPNLKYLIQKTIDSVIKENNVYRKKPNDKGISA